MRRRTFLLSMAALAGRPLLAPSLPRASLRDIRNVIVIFQENWSFDALYGRFPGARGAAHSQKHVTQVDRRGIPYSHLPQPINTLARPAAHDPRFPADLPVAPFDLAKYVRPDDRTGDLVHRFYQEQFQINGGRMDKFAAWSDAAGLVMSGYDATAFPEGRLAQEFTLADNFFHAAFGGSFLNHFWFIAAATPVWPNAPANVVARLTAEGALMEDGIVTPDGYAVNTAYPLHKPFPASTPDPSRRVPLQTGPTIGDRLREADISWRWYGGGYEDALAGRPAPSFQYHHHPFVYFARYAEGTEAKAAHLRDEENFYEDLRVGRLPSVSFIKLLGLDNEHPGYTSVMRGQQRVARIVETVRESRYWSNCAIFITYDEHGGRWDHVAPPKIDRWGPGTRVPAIIISPFAKKRHVDHTLYDTTSILRFIERRWNLRPLSSRDARANDLTNAFDFRS